MAHPQTAFSPSQGGVQVSVYSALNILWLLHASLEAPVAFLGLFFTGGLSFTDEITATMVVVIKLYSALALSLSLICVLVYGLPDYMPGKRAVAILLLLYHGAASSILLNAEPFIAYTLPIPENVAKLGVRVETVAGVTHGLLSLLTVSWWQASLASVQAQNGPPGVSAVQAKKKK